MSFGTPTLLGHCEPICHLARGGMGELYLARKCGAQGFEKLVVLKTIPAGRSAVERKRLIEEARIGATLNNGDANMQWVYGRIDAVFQEGDASDAGMVWYAITGDSSGTPSKLKNFFGL